MVECKRLIVPVFFDVEPRDVRRQTGPFEHAFTRHCNYNSVDKEEVSKWRGALTKAGEVSGYNLADTNGDQAKLVRLIVKRIMREIYKTPLYVVEHPVGLDSRIADLMKLLDVEVQDKAKMVGIHAMGGMGKTTLVKAVYNQISTRFDACSFISNVREVAKQPTGLVSLQKQLLHDVFNDKNVIVNNTAQGIGKIKERIGSKKVLLVLDDVDHKSQLDALAGGVNWFSTGSIIIITTRDQQILTAQSVFNLYDLKGLDDTKSLQLFSWHAFGREEPNAEFVELSKKVAATAAGLPLALEIFGSHCFNLGKEKQWIEMLEKLTKDQNKDIHEKLKISYDALDEEEKRVFLYIACFFIGKERKFATLMWEDCKFFPGITINVLVHKSLVNINDDTGEFEMHDQIRDMGRKIVQDESLSNPELCSSRLWKDGDETLDVLKDKREMKNVEAVQLSCEDFMSVSGEFFTKMSRLRMLRLGYNVQWDGGHQLFPSKLRWLEWHPKDLDSLPDGRYLEEIVVLDLFNSSISQLWNPHTSAMTKAFGKLKVLHLHYCWKLTSCPDFKSMPHLQELNLEGCLKMSDVHPSIGHLKQLTHLSLGNCNSLKELPPEVWQLTSLEEFNLSDCSEIRALPLQKQLVLDKLKSLDLKNCVKLRICPEFTGMPHLEMLTFEGCREMSELHPSIGDLKRLTHLSLDWCHSLNELPEEIWQLTALEVIEHRYLFRITKRPSHLGDSELLKLPFHGNKLEVLCLRGCKNITKCPDFTIIPHLERLDFSGCEKMSELHPSIGHLKGLTKLNLSKCKSLKELPLEIWQLTSLKDFNLSNCPQLTDFLSQLGDYKSLERPLLGKLEALNIAGCENLTTCPDFMSMLKCLTILDLSHSISLKELSEEVGQLTSLRSLILVSCSQISTLPESMGHLKQLKSLFLSECSSLKEVPKCMVSLDMLQYLTVAGCVHLEFLPQLPASLTKLVAKGCCQLKNIENVSNLERLCELCLDDCERLGDVPGIEELKCLEILQLEGCRSLCNSFWEILQEANFKNLDELSIPRSPIKSEGSCQQSLSFLLPKQFMSGLLYLYVDRRLLDRAVRIDITVEDSQYSFSTSVNKRGKVWRSYYVATFGRDSNLMMRAREGGFAGYHSNAAQRKTFMTMRVSIDGCILLDGDLFTSLSSPFFVGDLEPLDVFAENIVMVEFGFVW